VIAHALALRFATASVPSTVARAVARQAVERQAVREGFVATECGQRQPFLA